jgi:hypothetical protein
MATAHQIVGILIRHCVERRIMPFDVDSAMLDEAAVEYMDKPVGLSAQAIRNALDPVHGVSLRTSVRRSGSVGRQEGARRLSDAARKRCKSG